MRVGPLEGTHPDLVASELEEFESKPFGNGNGRSARICANLLLMRYGMRPILRLRPRPDTPYGLAGRAGMQSDSAPMAVLIRSLHDASFAGQPIQGKKVAKKSKK